MKRLKALELENAKLKRLLAEAEARLQMIEAALKTAGIEQRERVRARLMEIFAKDEALPLLAEIEAPFP